MALKPMGIMSNFESPFYQHFIGPPNTDLPDSLNSHLCICKACQGCLLFMPQPQPWPYLKQLEILEVTSKSLPRC